MSCDAFLPFLETGRAKIDRAFRIALGDLATNIIPFKDGLNSEKSYAIMAGLDYNTPWTRDAAINTWNGAGLIFPEVAKNTLLSVVQPPDAASGVRIAGQYWDAIIWTQGAWAYYLYTGDREFLKLAIETVTNSLKWFEETEFDPADGLFRGPACYGDGVAAYPDRYAATIGGSSFILDWLQRNPQDAAKKGVGMPMKALSTNCLYQNAYVLAGIMAAELGLEPRRDWADKAEALRAAINKYFWNDRTGRFRYLHDQWGGCDREEGLGHSFALLLGLADTARAAKVLDSVHCTPYGIPCVWPSYERYDVPGREAFGRHSGTVWPHVQGFWAEAAARHNRPDIFERELTALASNAIRDGQFTEIYDPVTGLPTGGRQEDKAKGICDCRAKDRQTWSATAYIRMVFLGLCGMRFTPAGLSFEPCTVTGLKMLKLSGLRYRSMKLDIEITGTGRTVRELTINGTPSPDRTVPCDLKGGLTVVART